MMLEKHWIEVKSLLEGSLSKSEFDSWIHPIRYVSSTPDKLTVSVPTSYNLVWLQENYLNDISQRLNSMSGSVISLDVIVVAPETSDTVAPAHDEPSPALSIQEKVDPFIRDHSILQNYTFNRFIIGDNNALAHAAALKVANTPAPPTTRFFCMVVLALGRLI